MLSIYHQLGHRYNWNIDSIRDDNTGNGVIFAPRYMNPDFIGSTPIELRQSSFFDPQFFLPASRPGKLSEYNFFPDVIANGFSTTSYCDEVAYDSAVSCLQYQCDNDFAYCIIPTRYREGSPSDFIDSQIALFVEPFLATSKEMNITKPLLLQLIINESMLKENSFIDSILNWVTSIDELSGIYLIPQIRRSNKQVDDIDALLALMNFIYNLRLNDFVVIVGYVNTEAFPLLVADPDGLTLGSYENLRIFHTKPFEDQQPGPQQGPNARIYASSLLQWIDHGYLGAISRINDIEALFDDSPYRVHMFEPSYNWHFAKPEPYKHYFVAFSEQLRMYCNLPIKQKLTSIIDACNNALERFTELEEHGGIRFDANSDGHHLPRWITALNLFGREHSLI